MPFATILAARIVVLVTQDSLVTGKLAKVSENGSFFFQYHGQPQRKVVLKLEFSLLMSKINKGILNGDAE